MSRRALLYWLIGGLACVVLAAYLFGEYVELETVQKEGEMSLEARRNSWLATERFLKRMGRRTQRIKSPVALDSLPEGGVLVLADGRRGGVMNEARAQKILDWVARGGYLVLERDWGEVKKDPLLAPFGVSGCGCDSKTKKRGIERLEEGERYGLFVEAGLPGSKQRYRLDPKFRTMKAGETPPLWQIENSYGSQILHYVRGRGNVTVVGTLDFLDNDELGDFDHAEFFWALLQRYQPTGVIHFVSRLEYQTLWQWVLTTGWRVLLGAATLILLWLFRVVPRFGGVRAEPEAERRGLSEHLLALGRCLWREGALDTLLDTARREIAYRLAQRHPRIPQLPAAEQSQELARQSGLAAAEIDAALHRKTTPGGSIQLSPETFTRTMQTVQNLERAL
ncbi:MAG: DUF4350 domain-containing protein [Zoogloeaceae bacterium]|nr:DUF4350 domain-containing protein [Zoogloeaceae bacterium]